jgi:hypothetical protein
MRVLGLLQRLWHIISIKLQKPLQQVIGDLSSSVHKWDKEEALRLISNALPKINPDFVSKILNELSKCEYETVRTKAAKMRKDIFDGSGSGTLRLLRNLALRVI